MNQVFMYHQTRHLQKVQALIRLQKIIQDSVVEIRLLFRRSLHHSPHFLRHSPKFFMSLKYLWKIRLFWAQSINISNTVSHLSIKSYYRPIPLEINDTSFTYCFHDHASANNIARVEWYCQVLRASIRPIFLWWQWKLRPGGSSAD